MNVRQALAAEARRILTEAHRIRRVARLAAVAAVAAATPEDGNNKKAVRENGFF